MSWASHNPELYDAICAQGVADKLSEIADVDYFPAAAIVETIQAECPSAFQSLVSWACKEVSNREADHFGRLTDTAMEQRTHG